jgi:hypothetical protein
VPNWPADVIGDEMVAAMDEVGVDGAISISPFSMYRYDGGYPVEVQRAHPDRFAIVKPVDPDDPAGIRSLTAFAHRPKCRPPRRHRRTGIDALASRRLDYIGGR